MAPSSAVDRIQETVAVVLLTLVVNLLLALHSAVTKGLPVLLRAAREEARRLPERSGQLAAWLRHAAASAHTPEAWAWVKQEVFRAEKALHRADEALVEALGHCLVYLSARGQKLGVLAREGFAKLPTRKGAALSALGPAGLRAQADASQVAMKNPAASSKERGAAHALVLPAEATLRGPVPSIGVALDPQAPHACLGSLGATASPDGKDQSTPASDPAPSSSPRNLGALDTAMDVAPCPRLEKAPFPVAGGSKGEAEEEHQEGETADGEEEHTASKATAADTMAAVGAAAESTASTVETPSAPGAAAPEPSETAEVAQLAPATMEAAPAAGKAALATVAAAPAAAKQSDAQEQTQKPASPVPIPVPEISLRRVTRSTTLNSHIRLPANASATNGVPWSSHAGTNSHVGAQPLAPKPRSTGRLFSPLVRSLSRTRFSSTDAYACETDNERTRPALRAPRARAVDPDLASEEARRVVAMEAARELRVGMAAGAKAREEPQREHRANKYKEDPFSGYASDTKLRRSRSTRSFWSSSREVPLARNRRA